MNLKLEHIGIAVKDMEMSKKLFTSLLNAEAYKTEEVADEGVLVSFFKSGDSKIELLKAINEHSPIAKFIEKKGEGVHHLAFEVGNIEEAMENLREKGFILLNETPKRGADNKLICFLHPKSTNGVLIELCQEIK